MSKKFGVAEMLDEHNRASTNEQKQESVSKEKVAPKADKTNKSGKKLVFDNKKETRSVHYQLLIKPSTKDKLERAASENETSMNNLINVVLEDWLNNNYQ